MANEVRRKRTRSRTALRLAAVIVCSLAAAWLATVMFGGRGDGRRLTATPEQVIDKLVSVGAKYETDDLGVVRYVDLNECKIADVDLTLLDHWSPCLCWTDALWAAVRVSDECVLRSGPACDNSTSDLVGWTNWRSAARPT